MFCTNCGKKISGDSKFCEYCGGKITYEETAKRDNIIDKKNKTSLSVQEILDIEEKNAANRTIRSGIIFIVIGLALTGITYAFAEPGGSYYIFWGLPIYGFYLLIKGLNRGSSIGNSESEEEILPDNENKEIVGWYDETRNHFFCNDCFGKMAVCDTNNHKAVRENDLNKNVYTCDACKKEF